MTKFAKAMLKPSLLVVAMHTAVLSVSYAAPAEPVTANKADRAAQSTNAPIHLETTIQLEQQQPLFLSIVPWKVQQHTALPQAPSPQPKTPMLRFVEPEQLQLQIRLQQQLSNPVKPNQQ